jgi:hypothetical protein
LDQINDEALTARFDELGLDRPASTRRFHFINNHAPAFRQAGERLKEESHD